MVALAESGEFLALKHLSEELVAIDVVNVQDEFSREHKALFNGSRTLKEIVEKMEQQIISQSLLRNKWNYTKTAKELGLSRVGLANKIRRYNLEQALISAKTAGGR